ncbi:GNAT family N-acetyltransferase [Runella sp. MFBS21]|uniref:GNAT family N-acetyltransferase n=1 Tax=Runella sp. MFBS21 TaxID=3034018 RepID=UPI0023FA457B|nr:GNAT family N-acetyltransferase [Runella sp. MFBS21]MDF7816306.1 GNAT family N-acetyltransferase [Runella sp. MFBS21]
MNLQETTFRKATPDDIDALIRLRTAFLKEIQPLETRQIDDETLHTSLKNYFKENIANDTFVAWLAEVDGQIIATSGLCFFQIVPGYTLQDGKIAYILNIYTLPEWRGRGIGKRIFEYILEETKQRGYQRISLHATSDGQPIYEKFGFRLTTDEMELRL